MKIFSWSVSGMVWAISGVLAAQQGTLSGPVAGFAFDRTGGVLRPIKGVPGASLLGDPIGFGLSVASVEVSPRQDSAVVVGADTSLHLFLLNGGSPTEVSLGGVSGAPQRVVYSPSGTAVALLGPGSARVLTGLPSAPTLAGSVTIHSDGALAKQVRNWALSDDGMYLLTVEQGSARLLSLQGQNRILIAAQASALVAFAPGGHEAAVMDSVIGLTLILDVTGTAGTQVLAAPDDSLAGPAGLAFSQDKQTLYLASAAAQSVVAFNLASASRTTVGCTCTPSTLVPMGNLFRLTELTGAPLWLLDSSTPRTVFVPARAE
jgi:DNA-binding beta-propeller fold protein YncE